MTFRAPDRTLTADEVSEFRLAAAARKTTNYRPESLVLFSSTDHA